MDFANYSIYDSWLSVTNSFVKKFINLILLSRIKNEKETRKMNQEFFTTEPIFHTNKNENSFFISSDGVDFSKIENKDLCLEIYFQRKNSPIKILIEKWVLSMSPTNDKGGGSTSQMNKINSLSLFQDSNCHVSGNKKFRKILIIKKLSTLIRSATSYTRLLPAYIFTNKSKKGFEYILDYKKIFSQMHISSDYLDQELSHKKLKLSDKIENKINQTDQIHQIIHMCEKFNKIKKKYTNSSDINIGKINLEVEYIDKNEIFILEQEIKYLLGKSNDILISTPNHNRNHSQRNVSYYDKLGIRKNTDTQDYSVRRNQNFHLFQQHDFNNNQLKKMSSRSLEKNLQNKKNEDECGDLNYSIVNSQEITKPLLNNYEYVQGYSPIKNYLINIHPTTDIVEIKLQHNFQEFISPTTLDIEIIQLGTIKTKKNYLFDKNLISTDFEPYDTRYETIENHQTDSFLFSDGEEEDFKISQYAEEILEISDDSQNQNFFLAEEVEKREEDFIKNIFTSFKNLKISLSLESKMDINIINLYKCVYKN